MKQVRVRFAPSPTGPLHIGGVRTALYNFLFARKNNGQFILRIEDTDSQRYVPGSEAYILEALQWCGITVDEGVGVGGPHAPYRQSERKAIYEAYAQQLVASGNAYYAFDKAATLDAMRADCESKGQTFAYNFALRDRMDTSLSLSPAALADRLQKGEPYVIRFKMPENVEVPMHDLIRGTLCVNTSTLDDKVLFKSSDGLPTYHLANIVDDHLMEITHVIRGEEWLPSLPLHYLLYQAFGWSETQPLFAHLPLLLKPQGQGKLSKRDGDKLGFPVFPLQWVAPDGEVSSGYREAGYFPDAFLNMLALLGWNPGTEQEIFSLEQLIQAFSLERVGKSGARFNPEKAKWFNAAYLRTKSDAWLGDQLVPLWQEKGLSVSREQATAAVSLVKERAVFVRDFLDLTSYLFIPPTSYDPKSMQKCRDENGKSYLEGLIHLCASLDTFDDAAVLEVHVRQWIAQNAYPMGKVMNVWRLAVLGSAQGPNIFAICSFLGKDETLRRMNKIIIQQG